MELSKIKEDAEKSAHEIDMLQFQIHAYFLGLQDAGLLNDKKFSNALSSFTGRMQTHIINLKGTLRSIPDSDFTPTNTDGE